MFILFQTDDIPFRIILLLMDEVFNLRNKDLWFRRRIMALLRQIIKTMQGGSINRYLTVIFYMFFLYASIIANLSIFLILPYE